jgi:uroporphyrinogen decarboxylase
MKSYELVAKVIKGEQVSKTPVYGWVRENLTPQISEVYGSVENFEDKYEFDMSHIFGGPNPYSDPNLRKLIDSGEEIHRKYFYHFRCQMLTMLNPT